VAIAKARADRAADLQQNYNAEATQSVGINRINQRAVKIKNERFHCSDYTASLRVQAQGHVLTATRQGLLMGPSACRRTADNGCGFDIAPARASAYARWKEHSGIYSYRCRLRARDCVSYATTDAIPYESVCQRLRGVASGVALKNGCAAPKWRATKILSRAQASGTGPRRRSIRHPRSTYLSLYRGIGMPATPPGCPA
jgi:hypothetical protein